MLKSQINSKMKKTILDNNSDRKAPLYKSLKRHITFFFKYLTIRKCVNIILALIEFKLKISISKSFPIYIRFEVSSICNLRCSGCLLGGAENYSIERKKNKITSLDDFKIAIKDFLPYLLKINLYDEGEPFLNKDVTKIVNFLNENKVATCISSNFSLKFSDKDLIDIVDSKLDHLIIAVDGIDPETYSQYRIGGDFNLVINNIQRLTTLIKQRNSQLKVEFQYLEFKNTIIDKKVVEKLAESLGVWKFTIIQNCNRTGWEASFFKGHPEDRKKLGCYYIWLSGSIISNGSYFACDFGEDFGMESIGFAKKFKKDKLRNHKSIVNLRKSFTRKGELSEICNKCPQFAKKNRKINLEEQNIPVEL